MHGGLFSKDDVTLKDIRTVDRVKQPPEEGIMSELLWSDPQPQNGRSESKRGVGMYQRIFSWTFLEHTFSGLQFGPDVTEHFLKFNNLEYVVRSHEVKQEGYELAHNGNEQLSFIFFIIDSFLSFRKMYHRLFCTELLWYDGKQRCLYHHSRRWCSTKIYFVCCSTTSSCSSNDVCQSIVDVWFDVKHSSLIMTKIHLFRWSVFFSSHVHWYLSFLSLSVFEFYSWSTHHTCAYLFRVVCSSVSLLIQVIKTNNLDEWWSKATLFDEFCFLLLFDRSNDLNNLGKTARRWQLRPLLRFISIVAPVNYWFLFSSFAISTWSVTLPMR